MLGDDVADAERMARLQLGQYPLLGQLPFFSEYLVWLITTGRFLREPAPAAVSRPARDFCSQAGVRWPKSCLSGCELS